MTRGTLGTVAASKRAAPAGRLSDRARAELLRFAHEGAELAGELSCMEGEGGQAYCDAREQLLAIRHGLIENRGMDFFTDGQDRRYALRSVIAWTAREAPVALRRELRNFAATMEVYS